MSWKSSKYYDQVRDENSFLFLVKSDEESVQKSCPLLLELRKDDLHVDNAIGRHRKCSPIFGFGFDILIHDNCNKKVDDKCSYLDVNSSRQHSYDIPKVNICGGNVNDAYESEKHLFQVIDYEVFQVV